MRNRTSRSTLRRALSKVTVMATGMVMRNSIGWGWKMSTSRKRKMTADWMKLAKCDEISRMDTMTRRN